MKIDELTQGAEGIRGQIGRVVKGQEDVVGLLLVAMLADGHVLMEGVPGTAKTMLARSFAACLGLDFHRIQFTPDLLPGDLLGTNLFDFATREFHLNQGPIFTEFLLADEINRTPPKTQAALLEAMQERNVTIDGKTHALPASFMVVATQNPIDQEGTYPLPEAQLDRFLVKIVVGYPSLDDELEMVRVHGTRSAMPKLEEFGLQPVWDREFLLRARRILAKIVLKEEIVQYVVRLVRATREEPSLSVGASPRSTNMLACASRARAILEGSGYVRPDDVKALFLPVLRHRVIQSPTAQIEGVPVDRTLQAILDRIPAPR